MRGMLAKREKIILSITLGVIIFAIPFNIFINPALTKNANLNKEIRVAKTKLKEYLQLLSQKEYIQDKYNKLPANPGGPETGEDTLISALAALEELARDSGIHLIEIRPQNPRKTDLYKEVIIDLRTLGNMQGYLKFLYNLENSLFLLRINKLELNAKPNTPELEGSFSISQVTLL